jgi:hypothetical protein
MANNKILKGSLVKNNSSLVERRLKTLKVILEELARKDR